MLRGLGGSWTNNGLAFTPNGRYVYFTLIPKRFGRGDPSLRLEQVSVATGRQQLLARGEQPAVSPNGAWLAYVSGEGRSATISVRNLASGATRSVNIWRLLGRNDILNASLAWLEDGTRLVVLEECCFSLDVATPRHPGPHGTSDSSNGDTLHLIAISVPTDGGLTARSIAPPGAMRMPETVGTEGARPDSLLTSSFAGHGDRAVVDRLVIGRSRATLTRLLTIAHAQVLGFDPSGQRLLYIVGHQPPGLWTASIENRHLSGARLLIPDSQLAAIAW